MYSRGEIGDGPNLTEAIRWYDAGLARGDGWGGANAAWIILDRDIAGLDAVDAAIRATKAAALRDEGAASEARALLDALGKRELTMAARRMLNELGVGLEADGLYGAQTRDAITGLAYAAGAAPELATPASRLTTVARLFWRANPFRVDLY